MPPLEFETTISAGERPQIYALERAATGPVIPTAIRTKYHLISQTASETRNMRDSEHVTRKPIVSSQTGGK